MIERGLALNIQLFVILLLRNGRDTSPRQSENLNEFVFEEELVHKFASDMSIGFSRCFVALSNRFFVTATNHWTVWQMLVDPGRLTGP